MLSFMQVNLSTVEHRKYWHETKNIMVRISIDAVWVMTDETDCDDNTFFSYVHLRNIPIMYKF